MDLYRPLSLSPSLSDSPLAVGERKVTSFQLGESERENERTSELRFCSPPQAKLGNKRTEEAGSELE